MTKEIDGLLSKNGATSVISRDSPKITAANAQAKRRIGILFQHLSLGFA